MRRSVGSAAVEASIPNDGAAVEEAARTRRGGKHSIFIETHKDLEGLVSNQAWLRRRRGRGLLRGCCRRGR